MSALKSVLNKCITDIDSGASRLSDEEAIKLTSLLREYTRKDNPVSKYEAARYLGMSRASFDNKVREGLLPEGKKQAGLKEKTWLISELDEYTKSKR